MKKTNCMNVVAAEERREDGFTYTYELILREGMRTDDWKLPLYSIKVSLVDSKGKKSEKEVKDIFTSKEKAESFFDMLVRNLATPIDLGYVVEDLIHT